jgi:hypothetical protein
LNIEVVFGFDIFILFFLLFVCLCALVLCLLAASFVHFYAFLTLDLGNPKLADIFQTFLGMKKLSNTLLFE